VDSASTPAAAKLESATTKARSRLTGPTAAKTAPSVAEARPAVRPAKPRAQVTKARGKEGAAKPTSKARERAQDWSAVKAALARQRARARAEQARAKAAHAAALRAWRRELHCQLGAQTWASLTLLLAVLASVALVPPWRFGGRIWPDSVSEEDHVCYEPWLLALCAQLALLLPLLPRILRLLCRTVAHEVNLGVALALNEDGGDPAKVATPLLHKLIPAFPDPPQQSLRPIRSMK
jgi:hypothetical protein